MKRYLFALICAFLLSLIFCRILIPVLRKFKAGQNILSYVKEHKKKGGTPTMGGIAFLSAACLITAIASPRRDKTLIVCLVIGLAYMAVGLIDDFLKMKHKENLGLKAYQKIVFQTLIALFAGIYCLRVGLTRIYIPFVDRWLSVGWWLLPISLFVFLATTNAVNLTDGLDGLAAGTSAPFFAALGVAIAQQGGSSSLSVLCFCLTGALGGYLLFNSPPASVFMGDTGSLSLGGFASIIAIASGNIFYIPIVGVCFVFSVISVLIQVIYYKVTGGKRVFLMAPVHHHFQEKGYAESKISYAYFAITLLLGLFSIAFL